MSFTDKAKNAVQKAKGKVKKAAGKVTDNERLEAEGKAHSTAVMLGAFSRLPHPWPPAS